MGPRMLKVVPRYFELIYWLDIHVCGDYHTYVHLARVQQRTKREFEKG